MSPFQRPLTRAEPTPAGSSPEPSAGSSVWSSSAGSSATPTLRVMEIGQHVIATLLTAVGVWRAIGDGTYVVTAVIVGLVILAWHTVGAVLLSQHRLRRLVVWWLIGFTAIWIAAVAVSAEFVWLAFLLWLLAGHLLSLGWGLLYSAVCLAIVVIAPLLHHGTTTYANVIGPLIGGIFAFAISRGYLQLLRDAEERELLVQSLTFAQQEMAELQDELALAQRHSGAIAERTRISRDIHDTIAQALSSIRLLAHAGGTRTTNADAARTFTQVERLATDSLADVRRIVAALVPAELEDGALTAALQRLLERAHDETGLKTELHVDGALPLLPTGIEVALLRTAQSAIANVRVHARATRVVMSVIEGHESVRLDVVDDGHGFDVSGWEQGDNLTSSSFGLRFMRARLRELGGGLEIESTLGEGTAVSVHVPILTEQTDLFDTQTDTQTGTRTDTTSKEIS